MIKYESTLVTFTEVPDEIALCLNITNCPCKCKGCFEPWLQDNYGDQVNEHILEKMRVKNPHVSCICFMGGDADHKEVIRLANYIHEHLHLKVAMYSGLTFWDEDLAAVLDYYKYGPFIEECGPMDKETTNQKFMKKESNQWIDITYRFLKKKV